MAVSWVVQFIIYHTLPVILLNDSVWYLDLTRYFTASGVFPDYYAASKPVHGMINYPLGYPIFLDFCRNFGSLQDWGRSIVLAQNLLSFGSVILLFLIGIRTGYKWEGFLSAVVYAFYLPRLIYAQAVMAETLCVFLLLLSIYIFWGILSKGASRKTGLLLGVVTAFAVLTKPLAILGAVVILIFLFMSPAGKKVLAGFILSMGLIILANFFYNWHYDGQFVLTTTSGSHLADRVFAFDKLVDHNDPDTREIISRCSKSGLVFRFPGEWWDYLRALRSDGLSAGEADHLLMKAALAGIRSNPSVYIKDIFLAFKKNVFAQDHWIERGWILTKANYFQYLRDWSSYRQGILPRAEYESRRKVLKTMAVDYPQGPMHDLGAGWISGFDSGLLRWRPFLGWIFLISFLYGFIAKHRVLLFFSSFVVMNLLFISLTEDPFSRYFEPFIPGAIFIVFLSISIFCKKIVRKPVLERKNDVY